MEKTIGKMRQRDFWAYGVGVLGISVTTQLISQLSFFYTDKVGMAATVAGIALAVTKIADAVTDLVMGQIVDRTNSKWGKARPWMLWMAFPALLAVLGLLCMPQGLSDTGKFIYAVVSNILATAVICTAISVPYACLLAFRTTDQNERTSMNVHRTICNFATGMFFSVGFIPLTNLMGGTQAAWIKVGVMVGAVAVAGMLICFWKTPEVSIGEDTSKKENRADTVPFGTSVHRLFSNKYWVIMAIAQLISNIIYSFTASTTVYYAKWIFGSENLMAVMGIIGFIPTMLGFFVISPLVPKFGPINVVRIGFAIGVMGAIIRIVFPYSFIAVCAGGALISLSTMPFMMVGMVLIAGIADFEEWKNGDPMVGMINSASSFGAKVGGGIGSGLILWVLGMFGYVSKAAEQTATAIQGVLVVCNWIPGIMVAILLVLMFVYDLDKKYPNFREELSARRAGGEK